MIALIKRSDCVGCSEKSPQGCEALPNLIFLISSLPRDWATALTSTSSLFGPQLSSAHRQMPNVPVHQWDVIPLGVAPGRCRMDPCWCCGSSVLVTRDLFLLREPGLAGWGGSGRFVCAPTQKRGYWGALYYYYYYFHPSLNFSRYFDSSRRPQVCIRGSYWKCLHSSNYHEIYFFVHKA